MTVNVLSVCKMHEISVLCFFCLDILYCC